VFLHFPQHFLKESGQIKRPDVPRALADNDAYHALQAVGGLIMTGPTGTNVNDVAVVLTE
jgi:hydroxypyruvate reductase